MKRFAYFFIKYWVRFGLFCYYRKIKVVGLENVPKNNPILFLSNHQSALIDVLLIVTLCGRKPWFLTRADVFTGKFVKSFFEFLQMLPIYRIRDGKQSVLKNKAIFDRCSSILMKNGCITLFPEANHNLQRRVRSLSKGFTRILDNTLEKAPNLDIHLVPVGQNYQNGVQSGDSTALYFGESINVQTLKDLDDRTTEIKTKISENLKMLTTHIEPLDEYDEKLRKLETTGVDFTDPITVNALLKNSDIKEQSSHRRLGERSIFRVLFHLMNLPLFLIWRLLLKPTVPEPEFMSTYRFGFGMLAYPLFYLLSFVVLTLTFETKAACLAVTLHAALSIILLKSMGPTSSDQRK